MQSYFNSSLEGAVFQSLSEHKASVSITHFLEMLGPKVLNEEIHNYIGQKSRQNCSKGIQ